MEPDSHPSPDGDQPATVPRPRIVFDVTALDTADPGGLAQFYATLLGAEVTRTDPDWHEVHGSGAHLAFQLAPDHVAPTWPDPAVPQQVHLDLDTDDLDAAEAWALSAGARKVDQGEAPDSFRVFADPSGHLFCLCKA